LKPFSKKYINQKKSSVTSCISYILMGCLLIFATPSLFSQQAVIKGKVTDKVAEIPYVNLELQGVDNSNYKQHTWSDSLGFYQFNVPGNSRYVIKASYLGYRDFVSDTIPVTTVQREYILNVVLREASEMLQEVVITSKKGLLEADKGKLTFNVQNSAMTTGLTALDMLKKLPGVTVGQNDEILFRGSAGINVMIDGKMTYLSGNQLAQYLKGMSAEDLNKIELITTPAAEFDAAGNAGIINIIPKKSQKKGYAVDLRTSVSKGKFWMTNENISASLRTQKTSIYGLFDFNTPHTFMQSQSGNTVRENGNTIQLRRKYENAFKTNYYTYRIGGNWEFLPQHRIGAHYHGYFDDWIGEKYSEVNRLNSSEGLQSYINAENRLIEPYHYDAVSLNYAFDIDTLGKKITADANYTSYRNISDGVLTTRNYAADGNYLSEDLLKISQPAFVHIVSAKADADLPFKNFTFKTGLKYAEVSNDNQYRYDSLQSGKYVEIEALSNHFKYKERISAVYLSGSKVLGKTSFEAGLRVEHTNADGYTVKQDITNQWEYTKLFPSLAISQVINDENKLDFSFSRRINRPSYTELNPVRWYNDPYFYYSGNPDLKPELAWVSSLTYSLMSQYIFSLSYNRGVNYINRKLVVDDNGVSIKSQSANFGKRHRFDITASVPFKPLPFWDVQFFSDLSYTSYPISRLEGEKVLKQWAMMASLQQDFSLPDDFTINIASYFYSSELRGIYKTKPAGYVDFGVRKSWMNKRLIAQLSISDVFNINRYRAYSQSDIADYYYNDKPYSRIIGLSLKYHFGGELIKSNYKKTEEQERL